MNHQELLSDLMDQINHLGQKIREMEELARQYGISIDDDNLYAALKGHRKGLEDLLKEFKRYK